LVAVVLEGPADGGDHHIPCVRRSTRAPRRSPAILPTASYFSEGDDAEPHTPRHATCCLRCPTNPQPAAERGKDIRGPEDQPEPSAYHMAGWGVAQALIPIVAIEPRRRHTGRKALAGDGAWRLAIAVVHDGFGREAEGVRLQLRAP